MLSCDIVLLGAFSVRVDGRAVPNWRHRRAAELVKLLALADHHRLHREQVMDALWPDADPEAAATNVRKAIHFARRVLGTERSIAVEREMVELWPDGEISVDSARFDQDARAAIRSADEAACARAADLYAGELLPEDRYAIWAEEPRQRLRLLALDVLKRAGRWERVLELDPADEEAHRELMQRALDAGDRNGVIRQLERLRDRLRVDIGMGPDQASIALYERALAMEGAEPPSTAERVRGMLGWGLIHLNTGDFQEAERMAEEARSLAIDAGLGLEVGESSALLGMVANMQGRWKELFRSEFVSSVRRSPEMASYVFDAHLCLAEFCLCGHTPYEQIVAYARELLEVAEDAGSSQGRGLAELLLGEADLFADRLDAAEEHLNKAAHLHEEADASSGRALAIQRLAETLVAQGQRWRAGRLLQRGIRLAEASHLSHHLVVRMHGALVEAAPDPATAIQLVEDGDSALSGTSICPSCSVGFRIAASIALARGRRLDQSRQRLEEAERVSGMWPGGPWHAAVWEARGVLRRAEGNEDQARALFKEAADRFAEARRPRDEARCRAAIAEADGEVAE